MAETETVVRESTGTYSSLSKNGEAATALDEALRKKVPASDAPENDTSSVTPPPSGKNKEKEGVNPQEASPPTDSLRAAETTLTEEASKQSAALHLDEQDASAGEQTDGVVEKVTLLDAGSIQRTNGGRSVPQWKKRKRGRRVRVVSVENDADDRPLRTKLPPHQYETTLRRRAIRKREESGTAPPSPRGSPASTGSRRSLFGHGSVDTIPRVPEALPDDSDDTEPLEEYGDVSLGMKLNIIGGRVIVQSLNSLADGRASPAQLTGLIQRGDVVLSINNVSLVNLPLDQLVEGLKPLSSPIHGTSYQRTVRLRFATGEGLALLNKSEAQLANKAEAADAATDIFSLAQFMPRDVPLVDHLSGAPLFGEKEEHGTKVEEVEIETPKAASLASEQTNHILRSEPMTVDQEISLGVAGQRQLDQKRFTSEFFAWNDKYSELLRSSMEVLSKLSEQKEDVDITRSEMLDQGTRAIAGAKALCYAMEDMDRGKDMRSFRKWNSTLSLRSKASTRRRFLVETGSLGESGNSDAASVGSSVSGDLDGPDGDEILLALAAHDEIWRRQVLENLKQAARELDEQETRSEDGDDSTSREDPAVSNLDDVMSSLLFGAQVSRILSQKKRSPALPPEEVTRVLVDLTTNLDSTMPDEIACTGQVIRSVQSFPVGFSKTKQYIDDNVSAAHFVLDEALPAWLKSFRPLPWEQRRVLWPHTQYFAGDSHTVGTSSQAHDDESLTLGSESTGHPTYAGSRPQKNLREQIEDMELDAETREDTCYLVTFFFTREVLPELKSAGEGSTERMEDEYCTVKGAVQFVKHYGAYLDLHRCLVSAAVLEADAVIASLLKMAKTDLRHRQAMKEISRTNVLIFYEKGMLSAILKRLLGIRQERREEHRRALVALCASAYPDLRPWQVRQACLGDVHKSETVEENGGSNEVDCRALYYDYLSLLLHPSDGNETARRDRSLVQEWCQLSVDSLTNQNLDNTNAASEAILKERRQNFFAVASKATDDHRLYCRDLTLLINLSMEIVAYDLALDLAGEIISHPTLSMDKQVLAGVLSHIRTVAKASLSTGSPSAPQQMDMQKLHRILRLFHNMSTSESEASRRSITVSDELHSLLLSSRGSDAPSHLTSKELALIDLLANAAAPTDTLQMFALLTRSKPLPSILPPVRKTLLHGAKIGIRTKELSGALLRIKQARLHASLTGEENGIRSVTTKRAKDSPFRSGNIWRRMHDGQANIEK